MNPIKRMLALAIIMLAVSSLTLPFAASAMANTGAPGTQTDSFTQSGTASVTPYCTTLTFASLTSMAMSSGNITGYSCNAGPTVGSIDVTETDLPSSSLMVSVQATDLVTTTAPSACPVSGSSCIPDSDLSFNTVGSGTPFNSGTTSTLSAPTTGILKFSGYTGGSDTTPGTTYSTPLVVVNSSTSVVGEWTVTGDTLSLASSTNVPDGTYNGKVEYTLTY